VSRDSIRQSEPGIKFFECGVLKMDFILVMKSVDI
jgi:hypothetical protein